MTLRIIAGLTLTPCSVGGRSTDPLMVSRHRYGVECDRNRNKLHQAGHVSGLSLFADILPGSALSFVNLDKVVPVFDVKESVMALARGESAVPNSLYCSVSTFLRE